MNRLNMRKLYNDFMQNVILHRFYPCLTRKQKKKLILRVEFEIIIFYLRFLRFFNETRIINILIRILQFLTKVLIILIIVNIFFFDISFIYFIGFLIKMLFYVFLLFLWNVSIIFSSILSKFFAAKERIKMTRKNRKKRETIMRKKRFTYRFYRYLKDKVLKCSNKKAI